MEGVYYQCLKWDLENWGKTMLRYIHWTLKFGKYLFVFENELSMCLMNKAL